MVNPVSNQNDAISSIPVKVDKPDWMDKVIQIIQSDKPCFQKFKEIEIDKSLIFYNQDFLKKVKSVAGDQFNQMKEFDHALMEIIKKIHFFT